MRQGPDIGRSSRQSRCHSAEFGVRGVDLDVPTRRGVVEGGLEIGTEDLRGRGIDECCVERGDHLAGSRHKGQAALERFGRRAVGNRDGNGAVLRGCGRQRPQDRRGPIHRGTQRRMSRNKCRGDLADGVRSHGRRRPGANNAGRQCVRVDLAFAKSRQRRRERYCARSSVRFGVDRSNRIVELPVGGERAEAFGGGGGECPQEGGEILADTVRLLSRVGDSAHDDFGGPVATPHLDLDLDIRHRPGREGVEREWLATNGLPRRVRHDVHAETEHAVRAVG